MRRYLFFFLLMVARCTAAQNGYKVGDIVQEMTVVKVLNGSSPTASLGTIHANVTIVDFFGTWCQPCVKALPELLAFKNKFAGQVEVVLVSTESVDKLRAFVEKRNPFPFPVWIDSSKTYYDAFLPPSYPYTVLLDKNRKILAITNALDLTEKGLAKMIADSKDAVPVTGSSTDPMPHSTSSNTTTPPMMASDNKAVKLSQDFIYAAKTGEDLLPFVTALKNMDLGSLLVALPTDAEKKSFWINIYNGYTYATLKDDPNKYKNRKEFFTQQQIEIAGKKFSLDLIEHGILRRSKVKWALGYLGKWFPSKTEKQLRVDTLDHRIHFALNCGAKSCPPIAYYDAAYIDAQLDLAENAYLKDGVDYDSTKNTVSVPAIFSWFRGDFGGKKKIVQLLVRKGLVPSDKHPSIRFKKYDWTLFLDNFKDKQTNK